MKKLVLSSAAILLLLTLFLPSSARATTLLSWASSPDRGVTSGTAIPAANLTVTSGSWSRGSGALADAFGNGSAIYAAAGLNSSSMNLADYFEFTVAPATGYALNLTTLNLNTRVANASTTWTVRSSLDSYTANLIPAFSGSSGLVTSVTLSSTFADVNVPVTFRVYAWNSGGAGADAGFAVANTSLAGTVMSESVDDYHAIGDGTSHPLSEWTGTTGPHSRGFSGIDDIRAAYAALNATLSPPLALTDQIDFVAIAENFRVLGEGGTIRFTPSKIYVVNRPIDVNKIVNGVMTGATIRVAPEDVSGTGAYRGPYNLIHMHPASGRSSTAFTWAGGTFDGNKTNVDWPGTLTIPTRYVASGTAATGTNTAEWALHQQYGNSGLFGIQYVATATFTGVTVINSIGDGVAVTDAMQATFTDCSASAGAPLNYTTVLTNYGIGREGTFFKARHDTLSPGFTSGTMTVTNPQISNGGSIGVQLTSADKALPGSKIYVSGSGTGFIRDMSQESIHVEAAENVELRDIPLTAQTGTNETAEIQIASGAINALIQNVTIDNGDIDFRTGGALVSGQIINCNIANKENPSKYAVGNATFVSGGTFSSVGGGLDFVGDSGTASNVTLNGWVGTGINQAVAVADCYLTNTGSGFGIVSRDAGSLLVDATHITDTTIGISVRDGIDTATVEYCPIQQTQQNTIQTGTSNTLSLNACTFQDYGLDTTQVAALRASIGGNHGGANAATFDVNNSIFIYSAPNAYTAALVMKPPNGGHTITGTGNTNFP